MGGRDLFQFSNYCWFWRGGSVVLLNYHNGIYQLIIIIKNMIHILIHILIPILTLDLQAQIRRTHQLLHLHQHKLQILQGMQSSPTPTQSFEVIPYLQLNGTYAGNAIYVSPHFIVSDGWVCDLLDGAKLIKLSSPILCTDHNHITTLQQSTITLINIPSKEERTLPIATTQMVSHWQRIEEKYLLVQYDSNAIYIHTENSKKQMELKEQIIGVYFLNRDKIIYVTKQHYGTIRVQSLTILSQKPLPSPAVSSFRKYYSLYILLMNKKLIKISKEAIVDEYPLQTSMDLHQSKIQHIQPYTFISSSHSPCYIKLQYDHNTFKQSSTTCLSSTSTHPYRFQFYEDGSMIKFLLSDGDTTRNYMVISPMKEQMKPWNFPYQIVVIAVVVGVIWWRKWGVGSRGGWKKERKDRMRMEIQEYLRKP